MRAELPDAPRTSISVSGVASSDSGSSAPGVCTQVHTRLLKCTLELDSARVWWRHQAHDDDGVVSKRAFEEAWFGPRSLGRVKVLLTNLRARFDAWPKSLEVLRAWQHMEPETRALICHWHLQLSDPLYRAFSGRYLVDRHETARPDVTRDMVTTWVSAQGPGRWTLRTRMQFASQLLVSARAAGLVANQRDPRRLVFPRVDDIALEYLLHVLREVPFEGTLLENPYLASVGLSGWVLEDRLRALPSLRFSKQGDLVDFGWRSATIMDWAQHAVPMRPSMTAEQGAA